MTLSPSIAVIGAGYVGLIQAVGLSKQDHNVVCIDVSEERVAQLQKGVPPIYEDGLEDLLSEVIAAGRISFSLDIKEAETCSTFFVAVGTPTDEKTGNANLSYLYSAIEDIAKVAAKDAIVVVKSTVPIGTCERLQIRLDELVPEKKLAVVSNPEFLREGRAIRDFFHPERVVLGGNNADALAKVREIYGVFETANVPFVVSDWFSSETIKYAANAFLAMKVTFINEIANLTQTVGGDIETVSQGIGLDSRIGEQFLRVGPGYGGSCFPKDTLALATMARRHGVQQQILEAVIAVNDNRRYMILRRVEDILGQDLRGCKVAVLGIAFKANTDDIRDSSAISIIHTLLDEGVIVRAYDPMAKYENNDHKYAQSASVEDAMKDADLTLIVTEWDEFKTFDYNKQLSSVQQAKILDLRLSLKARQDELSDWDLNFIGINSENS